MKLQGKILTILFVFAIVLLLTPKTSNSTTILKISEEELYTRAKNIVVAECISIETREITDKNIPFTFTTFTVIEVLKGDISVGDQFSFRTFGYYSAPKIEGAPTFEVGEEMVLFLSAPNPKTGRPYIIGVYQGKYPIIKDLKTGKRLAVKPGHDGLATGQRLQNTVDLDYIKERARYYNQGEKKR